MAKCLTCSQEAHPEYEYCLDCVDFWWSETGGNSGPVTKKRQAELKKLAETLRRPTPLPADKSGLDTGSEVTPSK